MMFDSERIDREAAEWVVELNDLARDEEELKEEFLRWLMLSPQHKTAFTQTMDVFCALGILDRGRRVEVKALIERGSPKVIELALAASSLDDAGIGIPMM